MNPIFHAAAVERIAFFASQVRFLCDCTNLRSHRNYENCLQSGIEAFVWIDRAEGDYRQAVADGRIPFDFDIDKAFAKLYESWLQAYTLAKDWIVFCYALSDFSKFRECYKAAQDYLEWRVLRQQARIFRQGCPHSYSD